MASDPVPVNLKSEWIADQYHPFTGVITKCAACKGRVQFSNPTPRFCPNCGAEIANAGQTPKNWGRALDTF